MSMTAGVLVIVSTFLNQGFLLYADPGSGMLLWQLATAAALGLLFYAKTILRKLRLLFNQDKSKESESPSPKV